MAIIDGAVIPDAVPDDLAPASSLSMSDSQDAEYGETTTWAR